MKFHYDLTQAEPIVRDYPIYNSASTVLKKGCPMSFEGAITTPVNRYALQASNPAVCDNFVGMLNETPDATQSSSAYPSLGSNDPTLTALATGVTTYGKIIINPMAIYLAEYSQHADDDCVNTSADSTGKAFTTTATTDREGDWVYITNVGATNAGAGNLFMIGASTSTSSVTAATSYDDYLLGNGTSDTGIFITAPFSALVAGGGLDLSAATGQYGQKIKGAPAVGTGQIVVVQNYVQTIAGGPLEVLRVERHSGNNYNYSTTKLYADIQFSDHLLLGATLATRVIT